MGSTQRVPGAPPLIYLVQRATAAFCALIFRASGVILEAAVRPPRALDSQTDSVIWGRNTKAAQAKRNLVRLSVKFDASLDPADLRIGFDIIMPPIGVRPARKEHNGGGSS